MVPPSRSSISPGGTGIGSTAGPETRPPMAPETGAATEVHPTPGTRDSSADAATLARTEASHPEAPGTGMSEGPRLELQQWATRLSDLTREFEALPAGSAEANANLAETHSHLARLAAIQTRVEASLRSGVGGLAQDYIMLLNTSRGALAFLNSHPSDPGSEAYTAESTLVGALQPRRDRSLASLRTLATDRMIPSLGVADGAEPSEQQITDYRLLGQINDLLYQVTDEPLTLPRGMSEAYSSHVHPETMAVGMEMPDYMRSSFFRELNPHPVATGTPPAAGSPDADFREGHPMRDLYTALWNHRGDSVSESEATRLIRQIQGLRGELAEGGRYGNLEQPLHRSMISSDLERLEASLRESPRRISEDVFPGIRRLFHRIGALEYRAQLQGAHATSARGRIEIFWHLYEEYGRIGNREAQRGCLYDIYQISQMSLLPENRTNALNEADRRAILLRVTEAYADSGHLDSNFGSMAYALGREASRLWNEGTEDSRFAALGIWTQYTRLYRRIGREYGEAERNARGISSPERLFGTTEAGLPAILQAMENQARNSTDPSRGAARLIMVAQAYSATGDVRTSGDILRGVEGSLAAHPNTEGNPFASRYLILSTFSNAGLSSTLNNYVEGWISSDRAALHEASPRDRAHVLSETLQDWAAMMSGLTELGQGEMASRVFQAMEGEMGDLTSESRARIYREVLPHVTGSARGQILDRVRDLLGEEEITMEARIRLNSLVGEFSTDPFEIQGAMTALTSIARYERPTIEASVEIHQFRLAMRNRIDDLVHADPSRLVEGSDMHEMWLWVDGIGGRDGGSNGIIDDLTTARRALINRLPSSTNPGERRRLQTLLNDSFREGMRMRLHGNDYGLSALVDQQLDMIRGLPASERVAVFVDNLRFLNQLSEERNRGGTAARISIDNSYSQAMTEAMPGIISGIPAGPERRTAILQLTQALSQIRESETRRLRARESSVLGEVATERARRAREYGGGFVNDLLVPFGGETVEGWAARHGIVEEEDARISSVRGEMAVLENFRAREIALWNQFAEGATIPEERRVYEGFANAMRLTVEGRSGAARTAMLAYYSDPEVRTFLNSDAAGDASTVAAQRQVQQLLDVSETILNGVSEARFDRTLRIVRGLARLRLHTLRAEGEEFPYDIGSIDRMTSALPRFLATLPADRMPQTFEGALDAFAAADEGNARLVAEYNGAINRIPLTRTGSDGTERTGSVWNLIRAMEHVNEAGGGACAFAALQEVVIDDREWEWNSIEGRGDLGPALQDCCDIILEEGTDLSPELRLSVTGYRARIPDEEEEGAYMRQTFNWQLAVDIGLMALSGGAGGVARAAFSRMIMGLAESAALRMTSTAAMRFTMMAARGVSYVGGHIVSGITFNLVHSATSALVLNRPFENPFTSGLRMSGDSMINDPISMMLFSAIPGPSSMVGRFLYRQVATAITFQISQNIRYHSERAVRELLDSDFHRALERRERARAMFDATGDEYYQRELETAEAAVTSIIGHEPDNSVRGIMLNIGMNIGQAGADHVMGTHHWAGHVGLEAEAVHDAETREAIDPAQRREHHRSLADSLAARRASRFGTGRESTGPYRGGTEEAPARAAADRRGREEQAFFRELVDLDAFDHYSPETLEALVDQVAAHFDPASAHPELSGSDLANHQPALTEPARRFLRFFLTRVNPEHANRLGPRGLATMVEAVLGSGRGSESRDTSRPAERVTPVEISAERGSDLERGRAEERLPEWRPEREIPRWEEGMDRRITPDPEADLNFQIMADENLGAALAHLDDLLRLADPASLNTHEGRARFLSQYREASALLRSHPEVLRGLRPHEALTALMARGGSEDLPTRARHLVSGEIRLRPRSEVEAGRVAPAVHADSIERHIVAEELTSRHLEASLNASRNSLEHTHRELRELERALTSRAGESRFATILQQVRQLRVRMETARRRAEETRGLVSDLREAERNASRRGLDAEVRRELVERVNQLRRQIQGNLEGLHRAESGIGAFVAAATVMERTTPRPQGESRSPEPVRTEPRPGTERTGVRVESSPAAADTARAESTGDRPVETEGEGILPEASSIGATSRMNQGALAVMGLAAAGLTLFTPGSAQAQEAPSVPHAPEHVVQNAHSILSTFMHLSPMGMVGTVATVALGLGAAFAVARRFIARRSSESAETRETETRVEAQGLTASTRGEADTGGGGARDQGHPQESENEANAPELPSRMGDTNVETPVAPATPAPHLLAGGEGVLNDNAPGRPRRGSIERTEATAEYGTASASTHEGVGYKESNEDAILQGIDATGAHYAVVLDGMGGMGRGDQASRLAGEVIQREMAAHGNLLRAFVAAHREIQQRYRGAGACAVAHRVFRGADGRMRMEIIHAGDAGAVVFGRDGRILYRTRDQSQVQMMADSGMISSDELAMRTHPDVNIVLGGLGPGKGYPPHREEILLEGGERAVMFSDGLGDNASTGEIVAHTQASASATEAQQALTGLALQRMGVLDRLYPQFEELPDGARIAFTGPDGRTLYLARDTVSSAFQGETEMINVYDAPSGGNLIDHYKPDNISTHVYFHDPAVPAPSTREAAAEVGPDTAPQGYIPTVVPAEGAPAPIDLPPPPRLGETAAPAFSDPAEAATIAMLNNIRSAALRPPARPGDPYELHFPDLAGFLHVGSDTGMLEGTIADPRLGARHAVIERVGPNQLLIQNIGNHQSFAIGSDGTWIPVPQLGFIIESGTEVVMGGVRVRVTASGRAPIQEHEGGSGPFGYHPFETNHVFQPNFASGPQQGFGAILRPLPSTGRRGGPRFGITADPSSRGILIRENPGDPNSPWRPLGNGEEHELRFEHGVSEEFRNAQAMVFRMTADGRVYHVRGGGWTSEREAPLPPPMDVALGDQERFVIGSRPESDVRLPARHDGTLDPYLHQATRPEFRFNPDLPADHLEVFRTPEGEWRIRNLSGAVMEISGGGQHHFFLPHNGEMALADGQMVIFRGESPYRYRFRLPMAESASTELPLPTERGIERFQLWAESYLGSRDATELNLLLNARGAPFRVASTEGPVTAEEAVRGLAQTPPLLHLSFNNGRLTRESASRLLAFQALPESLRARLIATAQRFDSMMADPVLSENPMAVYYIRAAAERFQRHALNEGLYDLERALENLGPDNVAETEAALARLAFWSPENMSREPNLLLSGVTGRDGYYALADASPREFPDPVKRAEVQARVERMRADATQAGEQAQLIRARIQEHFTGTANPEVPALNPLNQRVMLTEMLERLQPEEMIETLEAEEVVETPRVEAHRAAPPPPPVSRSEARQDTPLPEGVSAQTPPAETSTAVQDSRRRARIALRQLGDLMSSYSVRRSPELTQALDSIRETLREGDPRELETRLNRVREIFSDPELRSLWEYAESLARGEERGVAARELLLAVLDGHVVDPEQARTYLRATRPALRAQVRMESVSRELRTVLRDAGLGDVDSNLELANGVLRPMLRRLFRNPESLPGDREVMQAMREFRETMRSLRLELEGHRDLTTEMRRSILEAYASEIASGRMDGEEALRLARAAETPAAIQEAIVEIREEEILPDDTLELTDSDFLPETPEVEGRVPETPTPVTRPISAPAEILASAPLPRLLMELIEQRYEASTERESHAAAARETLPRVIEAMNEARIDPETPLGQWLLSRILLESSQGRVPSSEGRMLSPEELNRESLAPRIEAERRIFEALRRAGFEPASREGLRLANFLLRRRAEQATEIAAGLRNTLRIDLSPELVRAVDRLVLLGGDRSAQARELWLEWALSRELGSDALQDAFWETLSGVRELRLGENGPESIDRRERPTRIASLGETVVHTLDELGIPSHSPAGSEIATLFLARSAVEASPGNPQFSFVALSEQGRDARSLVASLREIFTTVPDLSASDRGALTLWALRNRCTPSDLSGMLTLLRGAPSRERPSAPDVLSWILANNPNIETLREIQGGEYRLRRGPGGLRLVTRDGRAVTTDLAPHIGALREGFARDFGEGTATRTAAPPVETSPLGIAAVPGGEPESARPENGSRVADAATLLNDPARRDEFEASLIELEDAGLLEPGTPLEEYHYPAARILEGGARIPVYLRLEATAGTMGRIPYRMVESENGVIRLVRNDGLTEPSAPNEIRLAAGRLRNPFRPGDQIFLLHGISGGSENRPPSDAPEAPELPGRGMGDAEMESFLENRQNRDAMHPPLIDITKGQFIIPPLRLPNVEQIDGHTELTISLVNQGRHVELEPTLAQLESIATELAAVGGTVMGDLGPVAAAIRDEIALVRDTESDLGEMAAAIRQLGTILTLDQEFPSTDTKVRTYFQDQVLELYRRRALEATPPIAAPEVQNPENRPNPGPRVDRSTERLPISGPRTDRSTARLPNPNRASPENRTVPETPRVREPSPASPEEVALTAEMDQLAAAQLEEFSSLAQRTRRTLAEHDASVPDIGNDAEMQAWRNSRREIFAHYARERDRIARELVERHEGPGRRVLEFLRGLATNEEVWSEVEASGLERARIAPDVTPYGRPKETMDVVPKIERRGMTSLRSFADLFGTRIIVESYEDAIPLVAAIQRRFQVRPEYTRNGRLVFPPAYKRVRRGEAPDRVRLLLEEQNRPRLDQEGIGRVLDGRQSGYRSIHVVVEVDGLPVEIQIHTRLLHSWGIIQHEFYKNEVLQRPENSDVKAITDRYFAEVARYLAEREQGIARPSRPQPLEIPESRLARLPDDARNAIKLAGDSMENLMHSIREEAIETESPRAHETPAIVEIEDLSAHAVEIEDEFETIPEDLEIPMMSETEATARNRPSDFDSGNGLHSSFLGAGLMMAMTSMGHDPGISLLAGVFGTVLPFGVLGIFNWVRNRRNQTPPPDGPGSPGARTVAPSPATLEAAPAAMAAPPPAPMERPLLRPNTIGGNLPEIDAHLAGQTLNAEQISEVLRRHSRRVRLAGGELVYLADQGIDPKHPVGEDFMGGLEYRDPLGRRVYSMMVADGMGGMGHGDVAGMLTVEAFQAELRRTGDIRRAWELANASVRHFNFVVSETRDRNQAIEAARQWIADPSLVSAEEGRGGSGACSVSFSILPGAGPNGATVLQTHFAGDASLRVFRRRADGRLERVYSTVEENLGTIAADSRQEQGENLHRTREIRLHAMANTVTNGVGSHAHMQVSDTSRGEIPQPNGLVARSSGFEHGLVLREGDIVLAGSDGFWENFLETRMVGDLIEEARNAEEIHAILREETHARMEIVRRVRNRDLPTAANGRFRFNHRGHELFIDRSFNVYENETAAEPIDKFKPDNFSLAVYLHSPATVAAEHAPLGPTPQSAPLPPRAPEPSRRSSVVAPPIPAAARRPRPLPATEAPIVTMGPPVVVYGEHPYHLLQGGRLHEEERYLYQLRLDSAAQSIQPFFLEVESPTPLTQSELERLVNSSRRPHGVEMREGWRIRDYRRGEGDSAERVMTAIPIGMLPPAAGMRGVQVDFYLLASENTPIDTLSTNPRISIVDPTISRGLGKNAAFSLASSDSTSPTERSWVLRVQQDRIPVSVNEGTILPFDGMYRLSPGDRIQVGATSFIFRDGCLVPETTTALRLSVPPAVPPAQGLPLAAAVRSETPDPGPGPRRR